MTRRKSATGQQAFSFLGPNEKACVAGIKKKCTGPRCLREDPNGIIKPIEDFPKQKKGKDTSLCAECLAEVKLSQQLGITPDEFNHKLDAQGGRCVICRDVGKETKDILSTLRVDRNAKTNKIRGLVCSDCYMRINQWQWFLDNSEWRTIIELYLAEYNGT